MVDWSIVYTAFMQGIAIATGQLELLIPATDIGEALAYFLGPLGELLAEMAFLLLYPLIWMYIIFQNIVLGVLGPFINLINSVYLVGSSVYNVIMIFSGTFPTPWLTGLIGVLTIVVGLRIYSLIPLIGRK